MVTINPLLPTKSKFKVSNNNPSECLVNSQWIRDERITSDQVEDFYSSKKLSRVFIWGSEILIENEGYTTQRHDSEEM